MTSNPLAAVERTNLVVGALATFTGGFLGGPDVMLAVGVGAALAAANLWAIRRLARKAVDAVEGGVVRVPAIAAGRLVSGLLLKMVLLFSIVFIAVRVVRLDPLPLALGLFVLVVSLLGWGLWDGFRTRRDGDDALAVETREI